MRCPVVFPGRAGEANRNARGPRPVCGTLRAMHTLLVVIVSMLAGMAMAAEPVEWKVVLSPSFLRRNHALRMILVAPAILKLF